MKPITPTEVYEAKRIPDSVIECFNDLIGAKYSHTTRSATVKREDVLRHIQHKAGIPREEVLGNHWLDVEPLFEEAGWTVRYEQPHYAENRFDAFFEFSHKKG